MRVRIKGTRVYFDYLPVMPEAMLAIPPRMSIIASMMAIMYSPTAGYPMMIRAIIRIIMPSIVLQVTLPYIPLTSNPTPKISMPNAMKAIRSAPTI